MHRVKGSSPAAAASGSPIGASQLSLVMFRVGCSYVRPCGVTVTWDVVPNSRATVVVIKLRRTSAALTAHWQLASEFKSSVSRLTWNQLPLYGSSPSSSLSPI